MSEAYAMPAYIPERVLGLIERRVEEYRQTGVKRIERRQQLQAMLRQRHVSEPIIERVLRLNPYPQHGAMIRGLHRKRDPRWERGVFGRGEFIRKHGRDAWDRLPREAIWKEGRRKYVTMEAEQDRVWLHV